MALARRTIHSLGGPTYLPDARVEEALAIRRQDFNERLMQQQLAQQQLAQQNAAAQASVAQERLALDTWKAQQNAALEQQAQEWLQQYQGTQLGQGDRRLDQDMQQFAARLAQDQTALAQAWDEAVLGADTQRRGQDMRSEDSALDRRSRADLQAQKLLSDAGIAGAQIQSRESEGARDREFRAGQRERDVIADMLKQALGQEHALVLQQLGDRNRFQLQEREEKADARRSVFSAMNNAGLADLSPEEAQAALVNLQGQAAVLDPSLAQIVQGIAPSMLPEAPASNGTRLKQLLASGADMYFEGMGKIPQFRGAANMARAGWDAVLGGLFGDVNMQAQGESLEAGQTNQAALQAAMANNPMVQAAQSYPGPQAPGVPQPRSLEEMLKLAQLAAGGR